MWLSSSTDGRVYANDSVITWSNVYFNQSQSLKCVTEKQPCCSDPNPNGEWYYPNRTRVPSREAGYDFYTERRDDGTIHLFRNTSMPFTNIMQLCCELLNTHNLTQKLCVHLGESISLTAFNYCSLTFCAIFCIVAPVINEVTTTTISTYIDISFIQFRLFGIGNCYEWVVSVAKVYIIHAIYTVASI